MRASPRLVVLIGVAVLLVATIGPKLGFALSLGRDIPGATSAEIAGVVERSGYEVVGFPDGIGLASVEARSGSCSLLVIRVAPQGWNRSLVEKAAGPHPVRYVYDGESYAEHPVFRTSLRFYWESLKRRMGIDGTMPGVFAVSWTPGCPSPPEPDLASLTR